MKKTKIPELGLPDEMIEEIRNLVSGPVRELDEADLPEGTRQILMVSGHSLTSANFLDSTVSGKTYSGTVLLLTGTHSPSSHPELNRAYITFVEDTGSVRRPSYSRAQGTIWLWMHYRNLPAVLAQIHETKVYCWIGHFPQGHLYGDIHTSH